MYDNKLPTVGGHDDAGKSWATRHERAGAWIFLSFRVATQVNVMRFAQRSAWPIGGCVKLVRLTFSDGSSLQLELRCELGLLQVCIDMRCELGLLQLCITFDASLGCSRCV